MRSPTQAPTLLDASLRAFPTLLSTVVAVIAWAAVLGIEAGLAMVTTLFLHEAGHWLAMRRLGYERPAFIVVPLLGGLTFGRQRDRSESDEALMLLAGPAPGLVAAALWLALAPPESGLARVLFAHLLGVNLLNLMPIPPLDGGRIVSTLFLSRSPRGSRALLFAGGAILGGGGAALRDPVLLIAGALALYLATRPSPQIPPVRRTTELVRSLLFLAYAAALSLGLVLLARVLRP